MLTAIVIAQTISGTNSQLENCDSNKCTNQGRVPNSCIAGSPFQPCTCADGWGAVETGLYFTLGTVGEGMDPHRKLYGYTCCPSRGSTNGTCGDFDPDQFAGCDQDKCTSHGPQGINDADDCWAGTKNDPCTCADGWGAVELGHTHFYGEGLAYEYTCCPGKGSINGKCGAYVPNQAVLKGSGITITITIIVMSIVYVM